MDNYANVLFVTDFSRQSMAAGRRALRQAAKPGVRFSLLHVIEHFPEDTPPGWVPPEDIDPATYYRGRATEALADLAHELGCEDAGRDVIVTPGSAGHAIVEHAKQQGIDLIVAGAHGGWVAGMLGSTAMALAHHAPCDILLVR